MDVYGRPGVAPALLALQDEAGADLPLLLAALFAGQVRGVVLDEAALAAWTGLSAAWAEAAVRPLRLTRRALKAPPDGIETEAVADLRALVIAAERRAERVQLDALARLLPPPGARPSTDAAIANLQACIGRLPGYRAGRDGGAVAILVAAL